MPRMSTTLMYLLIITGVSALVGFAWQAYPASGNERLLCQPACARVVLDGFNLVEADLSNVDLSWASLVRSDLRNATLHALGVERR